MRNREVEKTTSEERFNRNRNDQLFRSNSDSKINKNRNRETNSDNRHYFSTDNDRFRGAEKKESYSTESPKNDEKIIKVGTEHKEVVNNNNNNKQDEITPSRGRDQDRNKNQERFNKFRDNSDKFQFKSRIPTREISDVETTKKFDGFTAQRSKSVEEPGKPYWNEDNKEEGTIRGGNPSQRSRAPITSGNSEGKSIGKTNESKISTEKEN